MTARILVFADVDPDAGPAFEAAFRTVTARMKGTPGLICDELLRDADKPGRYILFSEWESTEQFHAWEDAPGHHDISLPMRPYWSRSFERRIYDLAAKLG